MYGVKYFVWNFNRVGVNSIFSIQFRFRYFQFQFHYSQKVSIPIPQFQGFQFQFQFQFWRFQIQPQIQKWLVEVFRKIDYNHNNKEHVTVYEIIVINTISLISLVKWL